MTEEKEVEVIRRMFMSKVKGITDVGNVVIGVFSALDSHSRSHRYRVGNEWCEVIEVLSEKYEFLHKFQYKKICLQDWDENDWIMPMSIEGNSIIYTRSSTSVNLETDGYCSYMNRWKIWEKPKPKSKYKSAMDLAGKWLRSPDKMWTLVDALNEDKGLIYYDHAWRSVENLHNDKNLLWADNPRNKAMSLEVN